MFAMFAPLAANHRIGKPGPSRAVGAYGQRFQGNFSHIRFSHNQCFYFIAWFKFSVQFFCVFSRQNIRHSHLFCRCLLSMKSDLVRAQFYCWVPAAQSSMNIWCTLDKHILRAYNDCWAQICSDMPVLMTDRRLATKEFFIYNWKTTKLLSNNH